MMLRSNRILALALGAGLAISAPTAWAQHEHQGGGDQGGGNHGGGNHGGGDQGGGNHGGGAHGGGGGGHGMMGHPPEHERGPQGYQRIERPQGVEARPQQINRQAYNHNFTADHGYHVGPYHAPRGFAYYRWSYGNRMPRAYWGQQYWLGDYWLFGLDVPPMGYEWVRYGPDAVLIDTNNGEVIQVIYGRFQ